MVEIKNAVAFGRCWLHYWIDENGNIYSNRARYGLCRKLKFHMTTKRKLPQYPRLLICDGGRKRKENIAVVVLETFVGPRPIGMDSCHRDGNVMNNNLSNTRWDTRQANIDDGKDRRARGSRMGISKLKDEDVIEIISLRKDGLKQKDIGRMYNVSQMNISYILRGYSWGWLTGIKVRNE